MHKSNKTIIAGSIALVSLLLILTSCTPDTTDYVIDDVNNVYSKIVSCSIKGDVMSVTFSAFAENSAEINVSMAVWMSNDSGAGLTNESYSISRRKNYTISMSSFWFEQTGMHKNLYYTVILNVGAITHKLDFHDGEIIWFY